MTRLVRRLVFGLGNPGSEYDGTRHNVGFEVLDHLALHEGLLFEGSQSLEGYMGPGSFSCSRSFDPDALLVKPLTFMNRSGDAAAPLVEWAGVETEDVLVVYDDMDLDATTLRLRPFGGAGGQKGMRSIIDSLGTDRFPRLRIGIGRSSTDAARHVLSRFTGKEREDMDVSVAEASEAVLYWLRHGNIEQCMTRFHSRWSSPA
jgi:PTH1 family peptidyl-tRNA hydrolase